MKMKKLGTLIFAILIVLIGTFVINQVLVVRKAHSSFANYYTFRGCTQLVKKTDSYGLCKLASGKVIKLVNVQGKWYLDGDLPVCHFKFCW